MKIEVFLLLVLIAYAFPRRLNPSHRLRLMRRNLSDRRKAENRIIGGEEAHPHSIPYQAHVIYEGPYECNGALISTRWVVTSQMCAITVPGAVKPIVTLGAHNIMAIEDSQQTTYGYLMVNHPQFDPEHSAYHKVGLIRLAASMEINRFVDVISLPQPNYVNYTDEYLQVSGWGSRSGRRADKNVPYYVIVLGISNEQCKRHYGEYAHDGMLCTDTANGSKGWCDGDGGAPLVDLLATTLVGIVAFRDASTCYSKHPNGYTRMANYSQWIYDVIETMN